ncbi:MAG: DoxX family protein [Chitinophagia bacterium]|nr:DoxX family protein [Chitinophagia bacterium]
MHKVITVFLWLLRLTLGGLFIFSGVVKANDPLALAYKMNEIFEVWHWDFFVPYSLALSVAMISFEIFAGVAVIVGNFFRMYAYSMLAMNVFYTFLTWFVWKSGKIHECGCFGECIKIANDVTFYKDVALTSINLILCIFSLSVFPIFHKPAVNFGIVFGALVFSLVAQWYTLTYLPVVDCLSFRPGNNLWEKMQIPDGGGAPENENTTLYVYEKNGEVQSFTQQEIIDKKITQDPKWKFVEVKEEVKKGKQVKEEVKPEIPRDFSLNGVDGKDYTKQILTDSGYTFFWIVRDVETYNKKNLDRITALAQKAAELKVKFYVLTTAMPDDYSQLRVDWNMKNVTFFTIDYVISKTAIRTNPGLMLLHNGVVEKKWSYMSYPKDIVFENSNLVCK